MLSQAIGNRLRVLCSGMVLALYLSGCATKQWVLEQMAPLDQRLTTTERRLDETDAKVNEALARFDNLRMERQFVLNLKGGSEFAPGSSVLTEDGRRAVSGFLSDLGNTEGLVFLVAGHTDSVGSEERNYELGQKRAGSVARYLIKQGIDPFRVTTTSYGEDNPVADNSTRDGKRQNRRIEILVYREGIITTPRETAAQTTVPQAAY
jgi:peptidoglycan-associated lipoprotein